MRSRSAFGAFAVVALALLALSSAASAEIAPFCTPGAGAGHCNGPHGVAVDTEDTLVYVADRGNDRVQVFKSAGTEFASSIGVGQLSAPAWVAVDNAAASPSHHDLYASTEGFVVKKFKPNGEFIESIGEQGSGPCQLEGENDPIAVGSGGDLYVADSYDKDGAGPSHIFVNRIQRFNPAGKCVEEVVLFEGDTEFIFAFAVDSAGNFYVIVEGAGDVLRKYDPSGALLDELGPGIESEGPGVDGADHVFVRQRGVYVTKSALLYFFTEYDSTGTIVRRFGYGAPASVPSLVPYPTPDGDLYASEGAAGIKYLELPPPGPVTVPEACKVKEGALGNTKATLQAEVNPEGKATGFRYQYVTQAHFQAEGFANPEESPEVPLEGTVDFELHAAEQRVEGLLPETVYHCQVAAKNADSASPTIGKEGVFKTGPPFEFGPAWASAVGETSATVNAEGNPLGIPATGQIEYVEDAKYQASQASDGFAEALSAPTPELDYGASEEMQLRSVVLEGLTPGTLYHYRLRARNGNPPEGIVCTEGKTSCPELEHTFRTYLPEVAGFDARGYELVSPGIKNSAEVAVPGVAGGFAESDKASRIQASSGSGEAATYTSWTSFGAAEGAPGTSQYLSRRSAGGWVTENVSPRGFQSSIFAPPYLGFNSELSFMAFKVTEPPLTADCPPSYENLYLRENGSGTLTCLTAEAPNSPTGAETCLTYAGASQDGSRVFFATKLPYAGAPTGKGFSLYEWHEGQLHLVSILPGQSEAVAPSLKTSFGPGNGGCQVGQTIMRHVVSADGSRAIWTYVPKASATIAPVAPGAQTLTVTGAAAGTFTLTFQAQTTKPIAFNAKANSIQKELEALATIGPGNVEVTGTGPFQIIFKGPLAGTEEPIGANGSGLIDATPQLLVRVNGSETVPIDKRVSGAGKTSGEGVFWAASADDSVIYFTDENPLVSGSKAEAGAPDLYRYELGASEPLTDLTKGTVPGDVKGVVGASDDGSYLYFVAGAVLSEEPNEGGEEAQAGEDNLYLFHAGQTSFIATLDPEDELDWDSQPKGLSARVSPDGRHLAFLSIQAKALAGYENLIAPTSGVFAGGKHCQLNQFGEPVRSPLCPQAFLYDADSGKLACASCNPAGERPAGPTLLPGWTSVFEGPRYLSEDGSRLLFESYDALLQGDENLKRDVYEFELPGAGSCTEGNPNFDPASGGCHFLLSSGRSEDESYLLDASANGRDAFFSTRDRLVGWADPNENFDVYDYRAGGGFPEPPVPSICVGEASCKPPATPPPSPPSPATPTFTGPGNAKPKPAKKHKHKKHHKKKHKAKSKQRSHKRGGGR